MADGVYNVLKRGLANGSIDLLADTLKVLLVTSSYTFNADHDFLDEGGANDISDHEISVTGYTGGFGGAGRKTLASKTVTMVDASDRAEFDAADLVWTALGAGQTVAAAIMVKEVTADTDSLPLIYFDISDVILNGGDLTLAFGATGLLHLT